MRRTHRKHGLVSVIAMLFLILFSALALAYVSLTDTSMLQASNVGRVTDARFQAESGISFVLNCMRQTTAPPQSNDQQIFDSVAAEFSELLDGTNNLNGGTVSFDGDTLTIPEIAVGDDTAFGAQVVQLGSGRLRLFCTGRSGEVTRTVSLDLEAGAKASSVFNYGVASRGRVYLGGNTEIRGVNNPAEAEVLSARGYGEATQLHGHVTVDGDLTLTGDGSATFNGSHNSVGGTDDLDEIINNHLHLGVDEPTFPTVDTSIFEPFATNLINDSKVNGETYENIRIQSGSDTEFGKDVTINGVVFIEAPNAIVFKSDCVINGVVVTEEGTGNSDCRITFKSNVTSNPVETLPDTPQWQQLRELTGTFLIAPGFGVDFRGKASSFNGALAADSIDMWGQSSLTAKGFVIGLSDKDLTMHGNCEIYIDRDEADTTPSGFHQPMGMTPLPDTYTEH